MSTASAYINKKRIDAITSNNKVEYPGKVAKNIQPLAPSCPIQPKFDVLDYKDRSHKCDRKNVKTVLDCS